MIGPKTPIFRSKAYLRFVAGHDCFGCGIAGYSQAAHANFGKGLSIKAPDDQTFPLCGPRPGHQGCHTLHDMTFDMTREQRRELEAKFVKQMQAIAREAGWFNNKDAA